MFLSASFSQCLKLFLLSSPSHAGCSTESACESAPKANTPISCTRKQWTPSSLPLSRIFKFMPHGLRQCIARRHQGAKTAPRERHCARSFCPRAYLANALTNTKSTTTQENRKKASCNPTLNLQRTARRCFETHSFLGSCACQ